jgi:hypothetical protein
MFNVDYILNFLNKQENDWTLQYPNRMIVAKHMFNKY